MNVIRCSKLDNFCYVCGRFVSKRAHKAEASKLKNEFTPKFKFAYRCYFGQHAIPGEDYTPAVACGSCASSLNSWLFKKKTKMPFGTPMIWRPHTREHEHVETECYACVNYDEGMKTRKRVKNYVSTHSGTLPMPHRHDEDLPVPPTSMEVTGGEGSSAPFVFSEQSEMSVLPGQSEIADPTFELSIPTYRIRQREPELFTQEALDYLVALAGMSQRMAELMARALKVRHLTAPNFKITAYRRRQRRYQRYFTVNAAGTMDYCHDVVGLAREMGI